MRSLLNLAYYLFVNLFVNSCIDLVNLQLASGISTLAPDRRRHSDRSMGDREKYLALGTL